MAMFAVTSWLGRSSSRGDAAYILDSMKIFVSSLISGFEPFRAAVKAAIQTLRHEPIMAEDFGARADSPQVACLQGVRNSELVVLVLGGRYGAVQPGSGLSATHEEFREARERKPVLAFVQEGVQPDAEQATFINEVQGWQTGYFRSGFKTAEELRSAVTRALHDYELANAATPLDPAQLAAEAEALLPRRHRNQGPDTPTLRIAIAGGPSQRLLRPAKLETYELSEFIQQQALFGPQRIFDKSRGTEDHVEGDSLVLQQERGAGVRLSENGNLVLSLPLEEVKDRQRSGFGFAFAIIEETVVQRLTVGLAFANLLLDHVDPTQRLAQVAIAAAIDASDYMGWRTQAEQDAMPNSGTMRMGDDEDLTPVSLQVSRPKLRLAVHELAEDLMVKLRRQRTDDRRR